MAASCRKVFLAAAFSHLITLAFLLNTPGNATLSPKMGPDSSPPWGWLNKTRPLDATGVADNSITEAPTGMVCCGAAFGQPYSLRP